MNAMLVVTALVFTVLSVLWYMTRNPGWVFPIALSVFVAATIKGGVLPWMSVIFWLLIAAGVVAFFLSRPWFVRIAFVAAIVAVIVLAVVYLGSIPGNKTTATTPEAPTTTTATATVNPTIKDQADKALQANGWKPGQYLLGEDVDESKDKSTTGDGAFDQKGMKTPAEIVAFLKSGKKSANALLASVMEGSGAPKQEVLDASNWISVQSLVSFRYPGNTMFQDGKVVNTGHRDGSAGDIFLLFISPTTGKVVAVRSACANPQAFIPTPIPPDTDKEELKDKDPSQDPAPRGNAPVGGGRNADPGPGVYIPPKDMDKPPAAARIDPPRPTAPTIPIGSTPDPAPAPAPEHPSVPATGTVTRPGG